MNDNNKRGSALVKMALLVIFIAAGIYLVRFSPASQYLTAQQLGLFLEAIGFWAPLMFVIIYVAGVCLFLPGTLLTAMGAAIFGPYWGFLYVWTGAMIGAGLAFLIGRYLGRDFAASLIGDKLKRFDDAIERNGFATVLYLRLMYFLCPIKVDQALRSLVVTPDMHRVHHLVIIQETNSNFWFNLPWWDRLFGIYKDQPNKEHTDMVIGLAQFRNGS